MNIILGVTGSISAYKAYDILRGLVKTNHQVKVILTKGAENFILADTFLYLGAESVYTENDDFNPIANNGNVLHIVLKDWMDLLILAPASANTLAKFYAGNCDDLLSSVFLSNQKKQCLIFPAMNTEMYLNPTTQRNLDYLASLEHIFIHPPASGELACGEVGIGKLPCVDTIVETSLSFPLKKKLSPKSILITTGATTAPLDPVRFMTNPSSGKTGFELSKEYLKQGDQVTLIYGSSSIKEIMLLKDHPNIKLVKIHTTQDMYEQVLRHFEACDTYISCAAISDIKFIPNSEKLKKSNSKNELIFEWDTDILKEVIKKKTHQKIISFAAETDQLSKHFKNKWNNKPVDLMVGNQVNSGINQKQLGFGQDENHYYFVVNGSIIEEHDFTKNQLAHYLYHFSNQDMAIKNA